MSTLRLPKRSRPGAEAQPGVMLLLLIIGIAGIVIEMLVPGSAFRESSAFWRWC